MARFRDKQAFERSNREFMHCARQKSLSAHGDCREEGTGFHSMEYCIFSDSASRNHLCCDMIVRHKAVTHARPSEKGGLVRLP